MTNFICQILEVQLPDTKIFPAINIQLGEGITQLGGPNGSGKTTLLKAAAGILPFTGDCSIRGNSLKRHPEKYKALLGYCPDEFLFSEKITPREFFKFVMQCFKLNNYDMIEEDIKKIGLSGHIDKPIEVLSYGNRKKALLIASCLHVPSLLLLDEPLNGLDQQGQVWLTEKITNKMQRSTIFMVCHDKAWLNQFEHQQIDLA